MAQSWFSDPELLATNFSVSYVSNNLSKAGDTVVYAHMDDVVVVNVAQTPCVASKLPIAEKSFIHQVRLCTLQDSVFIVVASDNGVQIFDDKGEQSLYELALKDAMDASEEGVAVFCRGIAAINSSQSSIIVGTSLGKLLVLGKEKSSKATTTQEFDLLETLSEHKESISCIESSRDCALVASGDDSGLVLVHNPDDNFEVLHRIESSESVTSMRFALEHWLVCGYLTGSMRIYKKDSSFQLHAEVAAHTRAVTAIDVLENHVVSVSEDTFLNVWELSSSKTSGRVRLVSSHCVPNDLLAGVAFAGAKSILTATYDTSYLKLWVPE